MKPSFEEREEIARKVTCILLETSVSQSTAAIRLKIPTAYLSMIKNENYLCKIPRQAWEILEKVASGELPIAPKVEVPADKMHKKEGDKIIEKPVFLLNRGVSGEELAKAKAEGRMETVGSARTFIERMGESEDSFMMAEPGDIALDDEPDKVPDIAELPAEEPIEEEVHDLIHEEKPETAMEEKGIGQRQFLQDFTTPPVRKPIVEDEKTSIPTGGYIKHLEETKEEDMEIKKEVPAQSIESLVELVTKLCELKKANSGIEITASLNITIKFKD